ncbi:hypothetical protein ASD52_32815 [Ensifer sp. Root142]|nr:hypothetical protein ASD52_32815 [Ensifer sp. Root142]
MTEQREWWRSLLDFTPSEYASIGVTGIRNVTTDVIDKAVGGTIGLKSNIATTVVFGAADVGFDQCVERRDCRISNWPNCRITK